MQAIAAVTGRLPRRATVLVLSGILILAGCANVIDMGRDLARDLSDIDVEGMSGGLIGGNTFEFSPEQAAQLERIPKIPLLWRGDIEESRVMGFMPVAEGGAVYAAGANGLMVRFDPATGRQEGRVDTKRPLSGGVGTGEGMLLLGTLKGEVLAYGSDDGKLRWTARVSTEVLSPPRAANGMVAVRSGDGRIFGLEAGSGKRRWIYQGATPSLMVRSFAGVLILRDRVYAGFAGGRLVALDLENGRVVWEAVVSRARGATELERVTDITGLPVVDDYRICAVAYQGRVACFDLDRGNPIWTRDASSSAGLAMNDHHVYVSDAKGAVIAYDKNVGTDIWKQELLAGVQLSPPLVRDAYVVVGDSMGYVNVIRSDTGSIVARVATDGSAIVARPLPLPDGVLVQTRMGGLYAFGI